MNFQDWAQCVKIFKLYINAHHRAFFPEEVPNNQVHRMTHLVDISQPLSPVIPGYMERPPVGILFKQSQLGP